MSIPQFKGHLAFYSLLICSAPAAAQQLEEVLVTAPNKTQIADLTRLVPGFTFASGSSDDGQNILVRGVGTQSFSRSVD